MTTDTISEADFLLTELRYTLGQLHVQILDIDEETRESAACGGKTVNMILREMVNSEAEYQGRYRDLMHAKSSAAATAEHVPLPVDEAEEQPGLATVFEHWRAGTIALLEGIGPDWPEGLMELVKEQVRHDRQMTTHIAECRQSMFESNQRPDLNAPLTKTPRPHELEEEGSS